MSNAETAKAPTTSKKQTELEDLGHGIRGRSIPPEELSLNEDQIKKLAEESGSDTFAEFLFAIYRIKPRKEKTK